jgi:hypothetical protein
MTPTEPSSPPTATQTTRLRVDLSILMAVLGFLIVVIGTRPEIFGLSHKPGIGFVKLAVFLVGLGILCLGGYIGIAAFWKNTERSLLADIGIRIVATGYVVSFFSGMADVFGLGSQAPSPTNMFFGPLQAAGIELGELIILVGFLMFIPYQRRRAGRLPKKDAAVPPK